MHRGCDRSRSDSCETHVDYRAREGFKRPVVDVSGVGGGFTDQTAISGKANTIAVSPRLISWRQVGARPPSRRCQIQGQGSRASSRWRAQDRGAAPRVSSHDAILLAHTRKPAPAPDARRPTPDARDPQSAVAFGHGCVGASNPWRSARQRCGNQAGPMRHAPH